MLRQRVLQSGDARWILILQQETGNAGEEAVFEAAGVVQTGLDEHAFGFGAVGGGGRGKGDASGSEEVN